MRMASSWEPHCSSSSCEIVGTYSSARLVITDNVLLPAAQCAAISLPVCGWPVELWNDSRGVVLRSSQDVTEPKNTAWAMTMIDWKCSSFHTRLGTEGRDSKTWSLEGSVLLKGHVSVPYSSKERAAVRTKSPYVSELSAVVLRASYRFISLIRK